MIFFTNSLKLHQQHKNSIKLKLKFAIINYEYRYIFLYTRIVFPKIKFNNSY